MGKVKRLFAYKANNRKPFNTDTLEIEESKRILETLHFLGFKESQIRQVSRNTAIKETKVIAETEGTLLCFTKSQINEESPKFKIFIINSSNRFDFESLDFKYTVEILKQKMQQEFSVIDGFNACNILMDDRSLDAFMNKARAENENKAPRNLNRQHFTPEEQKKLLRLMGKHGDKWNFNYYEFLLAPDNSVFLMGYKEGERKRNFLNINKVVSSCGPPHYEMFCTANKETIKTINFSEIYNGISRILKELDPQSSYCGTEYTPAVNAE